MFRDVQVRQQFQEPPKRLAAGDHVRDARGTEYILQRATLRWGWVRTLDGRPAGMIQLRDLFLVVPPPKAEEGEPEVEMGGFDEAI